MAPTIVSDSSFHPLRERLERLRAKLASDRTSFETHWRDLSDFFQPRRSRFWPGDRNKGDRRSQRIIDQTGTLSLRTLKSGMHAGLTSPARPWMKLSTPDKALNKNGAVRAWLHEATELMLAFFAQSNLYNVLPTVYGDMALFATAAMSVLRDSRDLFRCYSYPVGSYYVGLDAREQPATFVYEHESTVHQLVERFIRIPNTRLLDWSHGSTTLRRLWESGEEQAAVRCVWVVTPNDGYRRDPGLKGRFRFGSYHYEAGENREERFLRVSGFDQFPVMVPRWDALTGDSYGTDSPGMASLGDVKQLQSMQRKKGQAVAKQVDPPVSAPTSLMTQKTSLLPGDVTYVDVREGQQGLRPIHEVNVNLRDLTADIAQTQYRIQRGWFEPLFLMLSEGDRTQPITAREVEERHEEKLLVLGPTLERTNDELLNPLVDRVWAMMVAAGQVPEAPPELHGMPLQVEYTSILSQAMKLVGVSGLDRFLASTLPLAQAFPGVLNKVNPYQVIDDYADMLGVDPRVVRETEEAERLTAQQQQAEAQANATAQAEQVAKAAQAAGNTPLDRDTVLRRILTGQGAA